MVCLTAIWKTEPSTAHSTLQSTNTSHQPISWSCSGSRLLIGKLLKSISQSWPQSASSNRPLHSTRLENGQVKGKVENEDEQSRIVQSSNQKSSPRVRLSQQKPPPMMADSRATLDAVGGSGADWHREASLRTLKRIACTNCEHENEKWKRAD
ncbi:MAG: hypothetical protein IPO72_19975 [Saprospiraceae bacterium]|nr:hypothetical protein [Candidatus Vicinibacter affinis]